MGLVTLTGSGGVGKTRLALHVMEAVYDHDHEVVFVDLAVVTSPDQVLPAIARPLGVHDAAASKMLDQVVRALADRRLLLVLDNVEHVLDAAPSAAALIDRCPALTVLATSRERLQVQSEYVYPLPPLATPSDIRQHSAEQLAEFEAVPLFVDRARAVNPGFSPTPETISAIADICHRLDGLPLAIERADPESSLLTPREQDVLRLLIEGKSNPEIADALFISPRTATTHPRHQHPGQVRRRDPRRRRHLRLPARPRLTIPSPHRRTPRIYVDQAGSGHRRKSYD